MSSLEVELARLRASVDAIDEQLVDLLNQRAALAVLMGQIKRQLQAPIKDEAREVQVKQKLTALSHGQTLSPRAICKIYEPIFDACLEVQLSPRANAQADEA